MTLYRLTMEIQVDDELLAEHDGYNKPPPNDLREWYGGDILTAFNDGLAEPVHDQVQLERVTEAEDA